MVRSQLVAAPLIVAQCGLQKITSLLYSGDPTALERFRLGESYTAAELLKLLSRAPPMMVLKLFDRINGSYLDNQFSKVKADLDFVQSVADLVSVNDQLNPSLNAVTEAFRRRHLSGRFVSENQSVKMDALVYAESTTVTDRDRAATDIVDHYSPKGKKSSNRVGTPTKVCFAYQKGECRWRNCRFAHRCSRCNLLGHGEVDCLTRKSSKTNSPKQRATPGRSTSVTDSSDVPPHPRFRRDRN